MILVNFAFGLYQPVDEDNPRTALARFVLTAVFCLPVVYGLMASLPWAGIESLSMRLQIFILVLIVLLLRVLINRSQASSLFAPKILVIGTGEDALEVERILRHPEQGKIGVSGFFQVNSAEHAVEAEKIVSGVSLTEVVKRLKVDEIIVAVRERRGGALPLRELLECRLAGVRITDLSSFHERVRRQVRLDSLHASWLIFGEGFQQALGRVFVKRIFDLLFAAGLLILALPVMIVVAFLILYGDHGPIFFRQERVGLGGQVFRIIKFRCTQAVFGENGGSSGITVDDEQLTRIGRIIRKLRIDGLPQLFNVILGEMSLVGPRPEHPYFVDRLAREISFYGIRHCVKPGLTGWARVRRNQNNNGSIDAAIERLQYDLYYVKNHTLVLDTLVLLETVHVLLISKGTQ
jgi:sugar transferase (PEP-CTERM system associated)